MFLYSYFLSFLILALLLVPTPISYPSLSLLYSLFLYSYFLSFLILALLIVPNLHVVQLKKNPFPLPGSLLLLILILLLDLLIFVFFSQFLGSLLLLILIFPTKYPFPTPILPLTILLLLVVLHILFFYYLFPPTRCSSLLFTERLYLLLFFVSDIVFLIIFAQKTPAKGPMLNAYLLEYSVLTLTSHNALSDLIFTISNNFGSTFVPYFVSTPAPMLLFLLQLRLQLLF